MSTSPVIYDLEGLSLTDDERDFFNDAKPYGYIIFERNVDNPEQLLKLTDSLRELSGNPHVPILIDQEGGRVARLKPPHWPHFLSAKTLVEQGRGDVEETKKIIYQNALRLGEVLKQVGINVNCAPVLDIPAEGSDPIIGDRAYGDSPAPVIEFARAMADGLMGCGVMPVIKHIPGHGRANVDSHISLPKVDSPLSELEACDFEPFKALADLPYAMTAHIVYSAIDKGNCATFSSSVIEMIRKQIGFNGVLMSDALNMNALSGSYAKRAKLALAAGCDVVLHCDGNTPLSIAQRQEVAEVAGLLNEQAARFSQNLFGQVVNSELETA